VPAFLLSGRIADGVCVDPPVRGMLYTDDSVDFAGWLSIDTKKSL
jgi:hypothetical protein